MFSTLHTNKWLNTSLKAIHLGGWNEDFSPNLPLKPRFFHFTPTEQAHNPNPAQEEQSGDWCEYRILSEQLLLGVKEAGRQREFTEQFRPRRDNFPKEHAGCVRVCARTCTCVRAVRASVQIFESQIQSMGTPWVAHPLLFECHSLNSEHLFSCRTRWHQYLSPPWKTQWILGIGVKSQLFIYSALRCWLLYTYVYGEVRIPRSLKYALN